MNYHDACLLALFGWPQIYKIHFGDIVSHLYLLSSLFPGLVYLILFEVSKLVSFWPAALVITFSNPQHWLDKAFYGLVYLKVEFKISITKRRREFPRWRLGRVETNYFDFSLIDVRSWGLLDSPLLIRSANGKGFESFQHKESLLCSLGKYDRVSAAAFIFSYW